MKCPGCGEEMSPTHVDDIEMDMCMNCGGIWLDDAELDALVGTMTCPKCGVGMHVKEIRGVEYDKCPRCGSVWLDRGELGTMVEREPRAVDRHSRLAKFLDDSMTARNVMLAYSPEITKLGTVDPVVDEIFLIHNTGCLIAHATRRLKPDQDDTVLSAMLVAIQGFVQESFKDDADTTLKEIAFGKRRMLIDRGDNVLLAVILGEERELTQEDLERTRGQMGEVVLAVESSYREVLEEWDGIMERFRGCRDIIARIFQ